VLHGDPSDVEDDGFDDVDAEDFTAEAPDLALAADRGSPNILGWSGNVYCEDPQYGVYAEALGDPPAESDLRRVFVGIL